MSTIDTIEIPSSLTNFTQKKEYIVDLASSQINYNRVAFNNFNFGSNSLSVQIPAGQALLRNMYFNLNGTVTLSVAAENDTNGTIFPRPNDRVGFAAGGIWAITNNLSITIANVTMNYNSIKDSYALFSRMKRGYSTLYDYFSGDSSMLNDNCTQFPIGGAIGAGAQLGYSASGNLEVMGQYYSAGFSADVVQQRTMFLRVNCVAAGAGALGATNINVSYMMNIPITFGVLNALDNDQLAIPRSSNLLVQLNMDPTPRNLFVAYAGSSVANVATVFAYVTSVNATMSLNYRTVQVDDSLAPLAAFNTFVPYYTSYPVTGTGAPKTAVTVNIPQISLSTVPSHIILAIRPTYSARAPQANTFSLPPQYFHTISGCSLNFQRNNALVIPNSDAGAYNCFMLSRKNGYNGSFADYSGEPTSNLFAAGGADLTTGYANGLGGGIFVVTPQDLQYVQDVSQSPGTIPNGAQLVLSGSLTYYSNVVGAQNNNELAVYVVYPQIFQEISPGNYNIQAFDPSQGTITKLDSVLTDPRDLTARASVFGGGFFSNLKGLAKKGLDLAVKNSDKIFNAAKSVLPEKYSGAIDKIESYSNKLKNLYEGRGGFAGLSNEEYERSVHNELIEIVEDMEADGIPSYKIQELVEAHKPKVGRGIDVPRSELKNEARQTMKNRLLQFL
jgi:hypothetical protein